MYHNSPHDILPPIVAKVDKISQGDVADRGGVELVEHHCSAPSGVVEVPPAHMLQEIALQALSVRILGLYSVMKRREPLQLTYKK